MDFIKENLLYIAVTIVIVADFAALYYYARMTK